MNLTAFCGGRRVVIAVGRAFATSGCGGGSTAVVTARRYASVRPTVTVRLDTENVSAHRAMTNDPMYGETVVNPDVWRDWPVVTDKQFGDLMARDFGARTAEEVCDDFRKISVYAAGRFCLTDAAFDRLRKRLIAILPDVTDQQLASVFEVMPLWNAMNFKDPVFRELWSAFDAQCIDRYKSWSLNKLLLFMDHWYVMRLSRFSNFVWLSVRKLARKPSRLNPKQLVQMMFYANTSRKFLPTLPMYDIEQEIFSCYNDFNIKELCIVSLGFFKTQTPIRNQEIVRNLYNSVIGEISNISSMELAAFLKIFRYCTKHMNSDYTYKLMDMLVEKVDKVDLVCCTHMALLGTNLLIKHEGLLKKISQRIVNEISQARIKDIERITLSLTMLNYNPQTTPCIFETVINELRSDKRTTEFEQHTRCYAFTLSYLAINNMFPYDCISRVFTTETLHKCFGKRLCKFNVPRDILSLNNSLIIECPDYSGPLLPDALKESCDNHLAWHIPTTNTKLRIISDKNFVNVHKELVRLFGNESYLHVCYPLPHHPKADILFCINSDGKPVIIPETMKNKIALSDFKKPSPELGKWFALMVLVRNSVLYYSNNYNGLTSCKIRQLEKLGYQPISLTPKEVNSESDIQKAIFEKFKIHGISL